MFIPRIDYCQQHLDRWKDMLQVTDWFEFLDRPDRFHYLISRARPLTKQLIKEAGASTPSPSLLVWDEVTTLVSGWYGLWPNPSQHEKDASERIEALNMSWHYDFCGFVEYESDAAVVVLKKYEDIVREFNLVRASI